MKVNELMTRDPAALRSESTATEAATVMKREDCGSVPVVDGGKLVGIITDRDIVLRVVAAKKDPATVKMSEIMTKDPACIGPDTTAAEASKLMSDKQVRRLPVVENGKLVGMLVIGQLARHESNSAAGDTLKDVSQPSPKR